MTPIRWLPIPLLPLHCLQAQTVANFYLVLEQGLPVPCARTH